MTNIVYLHGKPAPITRFLRVSEHRRLEHLLEADRLPYDRFVIEAGCFKEQQDLIAALRQRGHELVLDTNVAELSAIAKCSGQARHAPWAASEGVLTEAHLRSGSNEHVIGSIARFAVRHGFLRVHAPTHFLENGTRDLWFAVDLDNCIALRRSLDAEGGKEISIDYPLLITKRAMDDAAERRAFVASLASLPADAVVLRVSGFGGSGTAAGTRKYINAAQDFHVLGKPVVADGVGGLAALAILAFGAAGGISFGVAARERFDASSWYKPPKSGGGGGKAHAVLVAGIDTLLRLDDAEAIMNAPGGRRLGACMDRRCCPQGFDDTRKDPKAHFLRQRAFRCDELSDVPEPMRARHYLDKTLQEDERRAKQLAKLKLGDEKLSARLYENANRLDRFSEVLGSLEQISATATRSPGFRNVKQNNEVKKDRR